MDEKTVTSLFEDMKSDISSFVKSNIEIAKLETFEKASKATATTSIYLLLFGLLYLIITLAFITLGFYLGHVLDSYWEGFGIATLGVVFMAIVLLIVKKPIKSYITNSIVKFLMRNEDEEIIYKTKS
ncbi:MAG: hypothetical protein GXZ03_09585 [Proteiniphilum sp.]|nr:hypothetical protein [Proteiniphilum sp.]